MGVRLSTWGSLSNQAYNDRYIHHSQQFSPGVEKVLGVFNDEFHVHLTKHLFCLTGNIIPHMRVSIWPIRRAGSWGVLCRKLEKKYKLFYHYLDLYLEK